MALYKYIFVFVFDDKERQTEGHPVEKVQAAGLVFPPMGPVDGFKQTADCFSQSIVSVVLSNYI
jgi:hypothetical protein